MHVGAGFKCDSYVQGKGISIISSLPFLVPYVTTVIDVQVRINLALPWVVSACMIDMGTATDSIA